jgi:hypothetical protein
LTFSLPIAKLSLMGTSLILAGRSGPGEASMTFATGSEQRNREDAMRLRHFLLPILLLLIAALPAKAATKRQAAPAPIPTGPAAGLVVRPNFSSTPGLVATCTAMAHKTPASLMENEEKLAWVLCDAVQLTQHLLTWRRQREGSAASGPHSFQELTRAVRQELTEALPRIQTSRRILEGVKIAKPALFRAPGRCALDLDGD